MMHYIWYTSNITIIGVSNLAPTSKFIVRVLSSIVCPSGKRTSNPKKLTQPSRVRASPICICIMCITRACADEPINNIHLHSVLGGCLALVMGSNVSLRSLSAPRPCRFISCLVSIYGRRGWNGRYGVFDCVLTLMYLWIISISYARAWSSS